MINHLFKFTAKIPYIYSALSIDVINKNNPTSRHKQFINKKKSNPSYQSLAQSK